jgi:hypothetical protein
MALTALLFGAVTLAHAAAVACKPLPSGVVSIPLSRIINETFYGMHIAVGTPPQDSIIKIDTGSFSLGLNNPNSNLCTRSDAPCAALGTYRNTSSSTAVYSFPDDLYPDYQDALIDHGFGSFINDTVSFGGSPAAPTTTVTDFTVGTLDEFFASFPIANPAAGIVGLAGFCLTDACNSFPDFISQLAARGIIPKRAFSIYLGPDIPDAKGTLLLGGIDRAKIGGPVFTFPVVNPSAFQSPYNVNFTSFELMRPENGTAKSNTTVYPQPPGSTALLDTGNFAWGLPLDLFNDLLPVLGLPADTDPYVPPFAVDCKLREVTDVVISVIFPSPSGSSAAPKIDIPLGRLITTLGGEDARCAIFVDGVEPSVGPNPNNAFGAPFLRNVYTTFDMDALTVSFAPVRYTDEQDVMAIE